MDLLADGAYGRMVAIRDGKYAETPLPETGGAARRVDVDAMYNIERFRPRYDGRGGGRCCSSASAPRSTPPS